MTVYTNTARFDASARALTEDEMRKIAPSIFAVQAHESRSERFRPIPTIELLRRLQSEGFSPVGVQQSRTRDESKREFTKHLIRLRRLDDAKEYSVGDTVCEMLLKNANDGTSAYDLLAGLFRIRCKNSLVTQTGTIDTVKVRHSGDVIPKVIEGTYRVLEQAKEALVAPDQWSGIGMPREAKMALAEAAHTLRFTGDTLASEAIRADQFLIARRPDDLGADLWTTFNVVQENLIRGGLHGRATDANGRPRSTSTREIKGIDDNVRLNKALWIVGEKLAETLRGTRAAA